MVNEYGSVGGGGPSSGYSGAAESGSAPAGVAGGASLGGGSSGSDSGAAAYYNAIVSAIAAKEAAAIANNPQGAVVGVSTSVREGGSDVTATMNPNTSPSVREIQGSAGIGGTEISVSPTGIPQSEGSIAASSNTISPQVYEQLISTSPTPTYTGQGGPALDILREVSATGQVNRNVQSLALGEALTPEQGAQLTSGVNYVRSLSPSGDASPSQDVSKLSPAVTSSSLYPYAFEGASTFFRETPILSSIYSLGQEFGSKGTPNITNIIASGGEWKSTSPVEKSPSYTINRWVQSAPIASVCPVPIGYPRFGSYPIGFNESRSNPTVLAIPTAGVRTYSCVAPNNAMFAACSYANPVGFVLACSAMPCPCITSPVPTKTGIDAQFLASPSTPTGTVPRNSTNFPGVEIRDVDACAIFSGVPGIIGFPETNIPTDWNGPGAVERNPRSLYSDAIALKEVAFSPLNGEVSFSNPPVMFSEYQEENPFVVS